MMLFSVPPPPLPLPFSSDNVQKMTHLIHCVFVKLQACMDGTISLQNILQKLSDIV